MSVVMETEIIVGIFTLAGALGGITIGASLNYLFLERSRRRERIDLLQEETMDSVNEFIASLLHFRMRIKIFGKAPKKEKMAMLGNLRKVNSEYVEAFKNLGKSYFKMNRYVKKGTIHEHFSDVNEKVGKLGKLCIEFIESQYTWLKDGQLSKQLDNLDKQFQKVLDACEQVRDNLLTG